MSFDTTYDTLSHNEYPIRRMIRQGLCIQLSGYQASNILIFAEPPEYHLALWNDAATSRQSLVCPVLKHSWIPQLLEVFFKSS